MARNISDIIESYLKKVMSASADNVIEVQRSELAETFQCVPSQINYVIATRFSTERGYIVESKRGGGGYIRIRQVEIGSHNTLIEAFEKFCQGLTQREAEGLIERLLRESVISSREAAMLLTASRREVLQLELPLRDRVRARLITEMLLALLAMDDERPK